MYVLILYPTFDQRRIHVSNQEVHTLATFLKKVHSVGGAVATLAAALLLVLGLLFPRAALAAETKMTA